MLYISIISRRRSVTVQELKQRLDVSEVTIRNDLNILEAEGIICRTHGGAMMAEDRRHFRSYSARISSNADKKRAIAKAACSLIKPYDVIYIDAGTTCRLFAAQMSAMDIEVQVVTNSIEVVNELMDAEHISIFCPGGSVRKEARAFIGDTALEALKNIHIKACFIGASGFSSTGVFSSQNMSEANLKKHVLQQSTYRVILADSGKYGIYGFSIFANASDVDLLVTDYDFNDAQFCANTGIEVLAGIKE
ncbi:DeoR/GlpR family DNA-binding transcription regulator [Treponema phagedenis]|uniref:DeoR/GlpR family DNA-binding transcription regulator n=1 Tax=Treponema phagedenis TaxID=162 RepID=UPI00292A42DE|nr:DeoR/GlpR family DNA-binding transcription regulator [Treponema phagedenis]